MATLADALAEQDSLDQAERFAEQSIAVYRRAYASAHPDLADALELKADILRRRGQLPGAEALQREAVSAWQQIYGKEHLAVADGVADLAGIVQRQGRLDEAALLYRDALEVFFRNRGERDVSTAIVLTNLAWTESLRRRFDEAELLYRRGVPVLDSAWTGQARLSSTLTDFATVLIERTSFAEAESYARRAYDLARAVLAPNHVDVIRPQRILGACLIQLRRFADAEPVLLDAHRKLLDGWGADSPFTRSSASVLVRMYELWGRPADADRYRSAPR
jgi:tetratricopeptide (TPR) repeat protein